MRAEAAARRVRPTCEDPVPGPDHGEAERWWINACGELLWCEYAENGQMRCHAEGPPLEVEEIARFTAGGCVSAAGPWAAGSNGWIGSICGKRLYCADVGGQWHCRELRSNEMR